MNPFIYNTQIEETYDDMPYDDMPYVWDEDQALEEYCLECVFGPEE
jgi:hypothetical protein